MRDHLPALRFKVLTLHADITLRMPRLRVLHNSRLQTLGVLHIHSLNVAIQLLLRTLLIITLARYPHSEAEWHALDTGLPDLLVELWVEADV